MNIQNVRAKAPHKAVDLPAPYTGSTVTRHGAYAVDVDEPAVDVLITSDFLEIADGAPSSVGPDAPSSPFVTRAEMEAALAGAGALTRVTEDSVTGGLRIAVTPAGKVNISEDGEEVDPFVGSSVQISPVGYIRAISFGGQGVLALNSPNGTVWNVTVADDGTIDAAAA